MNALNTALQQTQTTSGFNQSLYPRDRQSAQTSSQSYSQPCRFGQRLYEARKRYF